MAGVAAPEGAAFVAPPEARPCEAAVVVVEGAVVVAGVDVAVFEGRPVLISIEPLVAGTLALRRHAYNPMEKVNIPSANKVQK